MLNGLAFQGVTTPTKRRGNRYPTNTIADRMEQGRERADLTVEQAAEIIGLSASSWYKKVDHITPFKIEECGRLAEAIGAPAGWPFLDWTVGELLDRLAGRGPGGSGDA